jgi:hypothetical protein
LDGLVKDMLPIGYLCFGADDSGERLYVYNYGADVVRTDISAWEQLKADALEDDGETYDLAVISGWFERQERVN